MAGFVTVTAPSGIGTIRIRDRRRTRRAPRGAIVLAPRPTIQPARRSQRTIGWFTRDDARQFTMSFAAFFTAAMIFLG
ncbi:MAG: hypothetical protein GW859_02945 [Sphingomonadales bacterium]|nr:hypothetical protein [Sphingomonadales bacterium]